MEWTKKERICLVLSFVKQSFGWEIKMKFLSIYKCTHQSLINLHSELKILKKNIYIFVISTIINQKKKKDPNKASYLGSSMGASMYVLCIIRLSKKNLFIFIFFFFIYLSIYFAFFIIFNLWGEKKSFHFAIILLIY